MARRPRLPPPRALVLIAVGIALLAAAAVAVVLVTRNNASRQHSRALESLFQDDDHLVYASTPTVVHTLETLAGLGVDRLRVTILWKAIAPDPTSSQPPHFDATDPAAYPPAAWAPYDRLVRLARAHGIAVDFDPTAPGPLWAMTGGAPDLKSADHYEPIATDFGAFVTALGRRYSGSYRPPGAQPLPRVSFWSIWNEPNQPGWLAPQWATGAGPATMRSPVLYRQLVDASFAALTRTGHRAPADTILIGELAPEGSETTTRTSPIPPMPFVRALYCVDAGYQPLTGTAAATVGCPGTGSPDSFVKQHPGLFGPTGFAHHPYSFFLAPNVGMSDPNFVPLSDLSRLEYGLDAIFSAYGVRRRLPIYLTEYGYETDPPNPYRGVSPRLQSLFLNQALYIAARDPRVRALSQFLLYDARPNKRYRPGSVRYWSTFQTGLLYSDGTPKPALDSYRLPIFIADPVFSPGASTAIWGMVRPGRHHTQHVVIQWRALRGTYRTLATSSTLPSGVLELRVRLPGPGVVRLGWTSAAGQVFHSRTVAVQ